MQFPKPPEPSWKNQFDQLVGNIQKNTDAEERKLTRKLDDITTEVDMIEARIQMRIRELESLFVAKWVERLGATLIYGCAYLMRAFPFVVSLLSLMLLGFLCLKL